MSNMTRIPKWTASGKKFNSQFARRKPYELDRPREATSNNSRNPVRSAAPQGSEPAPDSLYYGTHGAFRKSEKDMRVHNRDRITKERITRLGVFKNGCGSEVIINNISDRVQRKVDKRIRQLVVPDDEVEWVRPPDTNATPTIVDDRFIGNVREPHPARHGVVSPNTVEDRYIRNIRKSQLERLDVVSALDRTNIAQNLRQSAIPGRFNRYNHYESMMRKSASQSGDDRSFNATDNNANCTSITACIPSQQLAKRLFSGMADLPLHEAGEMLNSGAMEVLGNGLKESINSARSKDKDHLENRAMSRLLNRTDRIVTTSDRSNCTISEERSDYLFPSSPQMFDTSAPCTPSIEKAFNNTLHCALDTELEISAERDSRLTGGESPLAQPSGSPFFILTPMSEAHSGFEEYVPEALSPDFSNMF